MKNDPLLVTVLGPTATGKTTFAARFAAEMGGEVISADSRQVYRRMDIGTGKDMQDYVVGGRRVPCHLTDIAEPGYKYSVFEFQRDFFRVYNELTSRGVQPVLCGGTGMYIESVLKGYRLVQVPHNEKLRKELESMTDNELIQILSRHRQLHNVTDTSSRKRLVRAVEIALYQSEYGDLEDNFTPAFRNLILGITADRAERRRRITERLEKRINSGMIEEVKELLHEGVSADDLKFYGLEYKFVTMYLLGEIDYDTMFSRLNTAIHQFAKRQMTWFRRMERQGFHIHWLDVKMPVDVKINKALKLYRESSG